MLRNAKRLALVVLLAMVTTCSGAARAEQHPPRPQEEQRSSSSSFPTEGSDLTRQLRLTPDQLDELRKVNLRVSTQLEDLRKELRENVLALLTPPQRTRLLTLLEEYERGERTDLDLRGELGLTGAQQARLRRLQSDYLARLEGMWKAYVADVRLLLTPTQAAALDDYLRQQAVAP